MECIINFQAAKAAANEFILKELAMHILENQNTPNPFYSKPTFSWDNLPSKCKAENNWFEKNYHKISWNYGDLSYSIVGAI